MCCYHDYFGSNMFSNHAESQAGPGGILEAQKVWQAVLGHPQLVMVCPFHGFVFRDQMGVSFHKRRCPKMNGL